MKGRSKSQARPRETPPWLKAELVRPDRKCAPEPSEEEMPPRGRRVKAERGEESRGGKSGSGTAQRTSFAPLMVVTAMGGVFAFRGRAHRPKPIFPMGEEDYVQ